MDGISWTKRHSNSSAEGSLHRPLYDGGRGSLALEKLIQVEMMESIETERLILKALEEKDTESILKIEGDRETA